MGTRDFNTYFQRSFKRYFGIFTTYDKWQKEDYVDYPPYGLAEISMYSLSLGGIVDFRFLPDEVFESLKPGHIRPSSPRLVTLFALFAMFAIIFLRLRHFGTLSRLSQFRSRTR